MLRKIFFIASILIFGAILYAVYYYLKILSEPAGMGLNAVPVNAVAIIECREPFPVWKKLRENRALWNRLQVTGFFSQADKNISFLDSIVSSDKSLSELVRYRPAVISLHRSGAREFNFLFILPVPPLFNNVYLENAIAAIAGPENHPATRMYDNAEISEISDASKKWVFASTVINGFFICSFSPLLVEDAIRQAASGHTLTALPEFGSLEKTADNKADANLYINFGTVPDFLTLFFQPGYSGSIRKIEHFANWSESDLLFNKENVTLNGFTFSANSSGKMVNLFTGEKPPAMRSGTVLPDNTAVYFYYGKAGSAPVRASYKEYLGVTGQLRDYEKQLKFLCDKTGDSPEKLLLPLLVDELIYFVTNPDSSDIRFNRFIALKTSSPEEASEKLSFINHVATTVADTLTADESYKDFIITYFSATSLLQILPCNPFEIPPAAFYVLMDEYLIFGFSRMGLHRLIDHYLTGKTLHDSPGFISFAEKQSSSPAMNIFINLKYAGKIAGNYLNDNASEFTGAFFTGWNQEQEGMVSLQLFTGENMVFTNFYAAFFDSKKTAGEDNTVKWVMHPDTVFSGRPCLLLNHTTKARDVFLQDEGNTIYLLNNAGTLLWKRRLNEKIISEVIQVDALKNNKLQMIFNTAHKIYLMDRKGRDVAPFPVPLPEKAVNGLAVFDYDHNRNYRVMVACSDRNIYCFDLNGKKVEGWNFPGASGVVKQPVKHFSVNGKDYIVTIDTIGNIYVVDRKGEKRVELKTLLRISPRNNFHLDVAGDVNKSRLVATDSTGTVHFVYFNDRHDTVTFETFSSEHFFNFSDLDSGGGKECIFLDKDMLQVFRQDRSQMFIYTFIRFVNFTPVVCEMPGKRKFIGVTVDKTGELFLFEPDGSLTTGFPLNGNTPFTLGDINNNNIVHLVVGTTEGVTDYELGKGNGKIK